MRHPESAYLIWWAHRNVVAPNPMEERSYQSKCSQMMERSAHENSGAHRITPERTGEDRRAQEKTSRTVLAGPS